jgi:hypothetical protein
VWSTRRQSRSVSRMKTCSVCLAPSQRNKRLTITVPLKRLQRSSGKRCLWSYDGYRGDGLGDHGEVRTNEDYSICWVSGSVLGSINNR